MDDSSLIKAAQAGDERAFEQLLERHYDMLFRFAMKWCGNRQDAEDVTQQACVKIARNIKQFDFRAKFSTWLYRIVLNTAQDWQRGQSRYSDRELESEEVASGTDNELLIYLAQLLAWIAELGAEFKDTVMLVLGEGLSHQEAADVLQVKESTVSWRIHTVRKKLKEFPSPFEGGVT